MEKIANALLDIQKKIQNAKKNAENEHFHNKYATLERVLDVVKEQANEKNILILQSTGKDQDGHFIQTRLIHASGEEYYSSKLYLVIDRPTMQGLGSALTYGRRYALNLAFGIGQEDDDGNAASKQEDFHLPPTRPMAKPSQPAPTATKKENPIGDMAGKITFGKFKGRTVQSVLDEKNGYEQLSSYVQFLKSNGNGKPMSAGVKQFVSEAEALMNPPGTFLSSQRDFNETMEQDLLK